MDSSNQTQVPEVQNQMPSVNNKPAGSKIIPLGLGILFVLVTIGAYLLGTKQNQTVVQNQQNPVVPTSIPSPTPDETANWKTYINSKFTFTLKHPPEWNIAEGKEGDYDVIEIYPSDKEINDIISEGPSPFTTIRIVVKNNPKDLSSREVALEDEKSMFVSGNFVSSLKFGPTINIGGVETEVITGQLPSWGRKGVYIPYKGMMYIISASSSDGRESVNKMIENVFDQILPTFKFTN